MSYTVLRRSQIGVQAAATPETPVTATVQLVGALSMRNDPQRELRDERRYGMGGSNVYDDLSYQSTGNYTGRVVVTELPYWLVAAITGNAAVYGPTTVGTTGKLWAFPQPIGDDGVPDLRPLTGYMGDNSQCLRVGGMYVSRLVITGDNRSAWTITVDLFGRLPATSTFAALTTPVNETVRNLLTTVAIDDVGGTMGTTTIAAMFYSFTWTYNTGVTPDFTMNGGTEPNMSGIQRDVPTCTLEYTAKWASGTNSTVSEFTDSLNPATVRLIRIRNVGSAIAGGSAFNTVDIDGAYVYTDFNAIDNERDGTTITRATLSAVENSTYDGKVAVNVTNALAAL